MEIKKSCFQEMVEHCRKEYPYEACGILAGEDGLATKIFAGTNTADTPATDYLLDSKEQLKIFNEMEHAGLEMLAIYHSHIDGVPYPSQKDRDTASYPETNYVIVSLSGSAEPEVKSFKIAAGRSENKKLTVIE